MKKGVVIALVVLVAIALMYMVTHKPSHPDQKQLTETAAQLAETAPAPEQKTAAPVPEPAAAPAPETAPGAASKATEVVLPPATPGEVDLEAAMAERSLGSPDAPVTVIDYSSLTCSHCGHFATEILPQVKARLIDTGKLRLIFRDFPIDAIAMKAAKLARCAPKEKYFDFLEVLFRNYTRWIQTKDPEAALMQFGALAGMDEKYMKACMADPALESAIANGLKEAQGKFYIKSTPSFVFDYGTEVLTGARSVEEFEKIVNRLSSGKKN